MKKGNLFKLLTALLVSMLFFNSCDLMNQGKKVTLFYINTENANDIPMGKDVEKGYKLTEEDLNMDLVKNKKWDNKIFIGWDKEPGYVVNEDTEITTKWIYEYAPEFTMDVTLNADGNEYFLCRIEKEKESYKLKILNEKNEEFKLGLDDLGHYTEGNIIKYYISEGKEFEIKTDFSCNEIYKEKPVIYIDDGITKKEVNGSLKCKFIKNECEEIKIGIKNVNLKYVYEGDENSRELGEIFEKNNESFVKNYYEDLKISDYILTLNMIEEAIYDKMVFPGTIHYFNYSNYNSIWDYNKFPKDEVYNKSYKGINLLSTLFKELNLTGSINRINTENGYFDYMMNDIKKEILPEKYYIGFDANENIDYVINEIKGTSVYYRKIKSLFEIGCKCLHKENKYIYFYNPFKFNYIVDDIIVARSGLSNGENDISRLLKNLSQNMDELENLKEYNNIFREIFCFIDEMDTENEDDLYELFDKFMYKIETEGLYKTLDGNILKEYKNNDGIYYEILSNKYDFREIFSGIKVIK